MTIGTRLFQKPLYLATTHSAGATSKRQIACNLV